MTYFLKNFIKNIFFPNNPNKHKKQNDEKVPHPPPEAMMAQS